MHADHAERGTQHDVYPDDFGWIARVMLAIVSRIVMTIPALRHVFNSRPFSLASSGGNEKNGRVVDTFWLSRYFSANSAYPKFGASTRYIFFGGN